MMILRGNVIENNDTKLYPLRMSWSKEARKASGGPLVAAVGESCSYFFRVAEIMTYAAGRRQAGMRYTTPSDVL